MNETKLNTREAIALVLTVAVAHSLLSIPKNLITSQKSAAILNVIFISILAISISYLIYRLFKSFPGKDILDISEFLGRQNFQKYSRNYFYSLFFIYN